MKKKKILFLGASITQGKISTNYVKMLQKTLGTNEYLYVNHGIAGYESYNVRIKLDKAINENPDFVVLLVGTNDITSSLDPKLAETTRKMKHIPHQPTLNHYCNNIETIIKRLKEETQAQIALASLPVIGENLESIENKTVYEYNTALKQIAKKEHIHYLHVYEKQRTYLLEKINGKGKDCVDSTKKAFKALFLHFLLFVPLDSIARKNGFLLLTDGIHQNSLGAKFIADEVEKFIKAQ